MNQQWMTILLSKGIELEQNLRKGFENVQEQFEAQIKKQLEDRGIRLSATDLAALLEGLSPKASRTALSYALDVIRPFSSGMGFRVSNLTDEHIEMVVPNRTRNKSEQGHMHEAAMVAAALEAAKLLWLRHADGPLSLQVKNFDVKFHQQTSESLRVRIDLDEQHREAVLGQLRQYQNSTTNLDVKVLDENRVTVAELNLTMSLHLALAIENASSENHETSEN